jgi:hypothetical protein
MTAACSTRRASFLNGQLRKNGHGWEGSNYNKTKKKNKNNNKNNGHG